jgi:FHA domain
MQSDHSLKEGQFAVEARITSSLPPDAAPPRADRPQAKPRTVTLSITGGLSEGTTRILESPETQLGRAQDNDVILDDQKVSRHHAVIRQEAGRFVIADLESTNGTFVGERRTQERILTDGDVIRLGDTTLLFSLA